jgi:hypothetical protein
MKTKTEKMLATMHVIMWILFVGISIQAGAIIISFFVSLHNPVAAKNLYMGLNFSALRQYSVGHYSATVTAVVVLLVLKAYIAYLAIRIFAAINFSHPFSPSVEALIEKISKVALAAGLTAWAANVYALWLADTAVGVTYHWPAAEFLLLAGVIFTIAQVFKRGIELQAENDLTV